MRRLFLALVLALAGVAPAKAAMVMGVGPLIVTSTYTGPQDVYASGTVSCRAFRACSSAAAAATKASNRLERTTDNHLCDFDVLTTGVLNTVATNCAPSGDNGSTRSTWCAVGSGHCGVETIYDQQGSGDYVQATPANQFLWIEACTCMDLSTAGASMVATVTIAASPWSIYTTVKDSGSGAPSEWWTTNSGPNAAGMYWEGNGGPNFQFFGNNGNLGAINSNAVSSGVIHTVIGIWEDPTSTIDADNSSVTLSTTGTDGPSATWTLSTMGTGAEFFEDIATSAAPTTGQRSAVCTNSATFWGFSC